MCAHFFHGPSQRVAQIERIGKQGPAGAFGQLCQVPAGIGVNCSFCPFTRHYFHGCNLLVAAIHDAPLLPHAGFGCCRKHAAGIVHIRLRRESSCVNCINTDVGEVGSADQVLQRFYRGKVYRQP